MNIAIVHNHPSGGAARAVYELGRGLAQRHAIDVFTLSSADETFVRSADYARSVRTLEYAAFRPVRFGLYLNDLRMYRDLVRLDDAYRQMAAAIDAGAYDVVLASACRVVQSPGALRFVRTPAAYYCHEPPRRFIEPARRPDAGPLPLYRRLRSIWHRPATRIMERALAERDHENVASACAVLTNSQFTAGLVREYYQRETEVCRLGVDVERIAPGAQAGGYVLSVGAIDRHKGFGFLNDSLRLVPVAFRPPLVIVGNYANEAVARELSAQADASGVQLTMRVRVTDAELRALYANATAFIYAPEREPFGLAVLEAMAAGLPVVAVGEGGVLESVLPDETAVLVPRRADALAAALERVLTDRALARSLGAEGRRVVEREWTWEAAARRIEDALERVAGRVPAGSTA
jgi:glycosyltransferase involved in cell wall biosynthesis